MRERPFAAAIAARASLALSLRRTWALQVVGVVGFAALMAGAAQVRVPLPFTPVPVTLQTGVALLSGATLGPIGGAAAMALFLLAGLAGFPVLTTGAVLGTTVGYLLGFIAAAAVVGVMSRCGWWGMALGMVAGGALILVCGSAGLSVVMHLEPAQAIAVGLVPFLFGDALKTGAALAAARLTRPAWRRLLR
jgi:biotin transport system substrate-specific component